MAEADKLIAQRDIQVGFKRYAAGDTLPADHHDAPAWIEYGSAAWVKEESAERVKAIRAADEPGLGGIAYGPEGGEESLVGKIPLTQQRKSQ